MTDAKDIGDPGWPQPTSVPATNTSLEVAADVEQQDADSFAGIDPQDDELQDLDDADPAAPLKPAFPDERANQARGNRGPEKQPGFGHGA